MNEKATNTFAAVVESELRKALGRTPTSEEIEECLRAVLTRASHNMSGAEMLGFQPEGSSQEEQQEAVRIEDLYQFLNQKIEEIKNRGR
jgi:DNA-directed RNA polymerase specialized sigma subunit